MTRASEFARRLGLHDRAGVTLAVLPVAVVATAVALGFPPAGVAAALVAAGVGLALVRPLRAAGFESVWLVALVASVLCGEVSAISFGGQSGRILWTDVVLGLGILVLFARGGFALEVPRAPFLAALIPMLVWSLIGLPFARDPLTAIAELKEWIVAFAIGACVVRWTRDLARVRVVLAVVALTGAGLALLMARVAFHDPRGFAFAVLTKTVDVPWGRTNYLAGLLLLAFPVGLGLLGAASRVWERVVWLGVIAVIAFGLAISASKGALLAVAIATPLAFLGPLARGTARLPRLILISAFALVVILFVAGPLRTALQYRMQASALGYSGDERMSLYRLAIESGLRYPVFGLGLNNFSVASHALHGIDTVPHNLELGFFAELGVPGLVLVLMWVATLLSAAWAAIRACAAPRERALALGVAAAILAAVIHNQVESTLYGEQFKVLLFALCAVIWRMGCPDPAVCTPPGTRRV